MEHSSEGKRDPADRSEAQKIKTHQNKTERKTLSAEGTTENKRSCYTVQTNWINLSGTSLRRLAQITRNRERVGRTRPPTRIGSSLPRSSPTVDNFSPICHINKLLRLFIAAGLRRRCRAVLSSLGIPIFLTFFFLVKCSVEKSLRIIKCFSLGVGKAPDGRYDIALRYSSSLTSDYK
ncbi:hypothetical protein EVAR_103253_1 [Eumeta japonica]|uniref:Uncharacterized protein n=1 Tax=Eumeta variegata TaxID=151549 RepID=A0A4C2A049_EUMVA|nr:hypothetical protein EVAR_103253_1 [Eumeta japonica]